MFICLLKVRRKVRIPRILQGKGEDKSHQIEINLIKENMFDCPSSNRRSIFLGQQENWQRYSRPYGTERVLSSVPLVLGGSGIPINRQKGEEGSCGEKLQSQQDKEGRSKVTSVSLIRYPVPDVTRSGWVPSPECRSNEFVSSDTERGRRVGSDLGDRCLESVCGARSCVPRPK